MLQGWEKGGSFRTKPGWALRGQAVACLESHCVAPPAYVGFFLQLGWVKWGFRSGFFSLECLKQQQMKNPTPAKQAGDAARKERCCAADLRGLFYLYRSLLAFVELALLQEKLVSSFPVRKKLLQLCN